MTADPDQLRQVLDNIVTNAVQSMPDRGRLTVRTCRLGGDTISITDTGVGIPPENLEILFKPLFTTRARGLGLGLAISKVMIEAHGGTIEVASMVDTGSTFKINLPVSGE